ncbi:translation initiation factor IF-2 [Alkaliphilus metalliredigens QYMF]|uniref:Translation initiation factor IF-2 n=1 Tax=Alkaliphilus metalliredigens (strain QYMF) TaxID=293826 RepID=IF2_ALKMQ|nr:translation initiation factor IF-2 [Alkaliphilus metalliredigens]A6TRK7.1 RecName: Full=Translation initiation factor IF-2 [Alkaliphilus metalliredigens QYMF]ABR48825.1 translation initiation factor IF-2 [Alkaliphilus metalliredigens QYMF]
MSKVRVYQLAKELGVSSKELIIKLKDLSIEVGNHMSTLNDDDANLLIELFTEDNKEVNSDSNQESKVNTDDKLDKIDKPNKIENAPSEENPKKNKKSKKKQKNKKKGPTMKDEKGLIEENTDEQILEIGESIILKDLTHMLDKTPTEVITKLIGLGMMVTINQEIDFDTAAMVASEYGVELKQAGVMDDSDVVDDLIIPEDDEKDLMSRPPVVTVMGHVDHGKTSLLDAIRKTKVTAKEAGGITQHIGASEIQINDKKIVFLDTPGHEAFTSMRARGAKVTDIAILVVAADDGVMPQTIEAINHAKAAEVPIIVAINKIDKPGANQDRVKQELSDHGILIEAWGGDVIAVPVSAIEGTNINELLEMILLVSEVEEFKANPNRQAIGVVIEAKLDKGKGTVATVLIQNGTLHVGDSVVVGSTYGRIRAMTNHVGEKLREATPSTAVEITGLSDVPEAGNQLVVVADDKMARNTAEKRAHKAKVAQQKITQRVSLDDLYNQMQQGEIKELNIIVKADVQGSVQAVKQSLEKLSNDKVSLRTIHGGVGAITESDVMLAAASNAIITGFNVRPTSTATAISKKEKVDIRTYRIIYNAIEDIEAAMVGMLDPEFKEVDLGKAEVRAAFKVPGAGVVAGSYITEGKILRSASIRLVRDGIVVHEGAIGSLRRFKDDVKEVNTGYECGIGIDKFNDVKEGDIIEAYTMEEIKR